MSVFCENDIEKIRELHSILLDETINLLKNSQNLSKKEFNASCAKLEKITQITSRQANTMLKISKIQYQKTEKQEVSEPTTLDLQTAARAIILHAKMPILLPKNPNETQKAIFSMVESENPYEEINFELLCEKIHEREYNAKKYIKCKKSPNEFYRNPEFTEYCSDKIEKDEALESDLEKYNKIRDFINFDRFPCDAYLADRGFLREKSRGEFVTFYMQQTIFDETANDENEIEVIKPPPDPEN